MRFQQQGLGEEEWGSFVVGSPWVPTAPRGFSPILAGPTVIPQGVSSGATSGNGHPCHPHLPLGATRHHPKGRRWREPKEGEFGSPGMPPAQVCVQDPQQLPV